MIAMTALNDLNTRFHRLQVFEEAYNIARTFQKLFNIAIRLKLHFGDS